MSKSIEADPRAITEIASKIDEIARELEDTLSKHPHLILATAGQDEVSTTVARTLDASAEAMTGDLNKGAHEFRKVAAVLRTNARRLAETDSLREALR